METLNLPEWALALIGFAWNALSGLLSSLLGASLGPIVVEALSAVLVQFGLLPGSLPLAKDEIVKRAAALKAHCAAQGK